MTQVEIVEVGPRDGLQNEPKFVPVADKIALIDALSACGFKRIEVASFVSPKWVPQMAGSAEVLSGINRHSNVAYTALTPNIRGLRDAVVAKADQVAVFGAASEAFSKANINATISESLDRFALLVEEAKSNDLPVRGYISCVTDCPYDGPVQPEAVARVAERLWSMGCFEISLGETLGHGSPDAVAAMLDAVGQVVPVEQLAGHFHDTSGAALDNIDVALGAGVRVFDTSIAGLGGCPYAPGAAGNLGTEKLANHLQKHGYSTGLTADALIPPATMARSFRQ